MSDWKLETARYKDARRTHAADGLIGKATPRPPSPKKRPRETPLWRVTYSHPHRWAEHIRYFSAESKGELLAKAPLVWNDYPRDHVSRLHQKDRALFTDLIDQDVAITSTEELAREFPNSPYFQRRAERTDS